MELSSATESEGFILDILRAAAGLFAAGLTSVGAVIYIRSIWRRASTTRWSSWLIWTFTGVSSLATYYGSGARESIWVPAVYAVFCAVAFVAAIVRRSPGGMERIEVICLAGALSSGLVWWLSGSAEYGQIASVATEVIAYVPIMMDAQGENRLSWMLDTVGSMFNLVAVSALSFGLLLYPVAILVCNAFVVWLIGKRRRSQGQDAVLNVGAELATA